MRHGDISSVIGAQRRVPVSLRVPADLADEVDGFAREHGVRKTDAYLFGSFARGSQTAGSDVDVRLVIDRGEGFTLRELSHFAKIVQQETGRECDVVSAADVANEALAAAIDRERVLVYERKTD